MKKKYMSLLLLVILLVAADQVSKLLVFNNIEIYHSIEIIPNFFKLTCNINHGAIFGLFEGQKWLFLIVAASLLFYLTHEVTKEENKKNVIPFSLMAAGVIGNSIDRVVFGYVRDFLDFKIFGYNFAVFNLADAFIVLGVLMFILIMILGVKNENKKRMD